MVHYINTLFATRRGSLDVRLSATQSPREQVACGNWFQHFITQLAPSGPIHYVARRPVVVLHQRGRLG